MRLARMVRTGLGLAVIATGVMFFAIGCANVQLGATNVTRFIVGGLLVACTGVLVLLVSEND
jgi:hypothetical protein